MEENYWKKLSKQTKSINCANYFFSIWNLADFCLGTWQNHGRNSMLFQNPKE
ncbi:MAG: hypothetical protein IJQ11_14405 [Bacteroidales bacterium]|nr:hypothetical protein [Bacteroidales bacterium]